MSPPTTTPITTATSALVTEDCAPNTHACELIATQLVGAEQMGQARRQELVGRVALGRVLLGEQPGRQRPGEDDHDDDEGEDDGDRSGRRDHPRACEHAGLLGQGGTGHTMLTSSCRSDRISWSAAGDSARARGSPPSWTRGSRSG